MKSPLILAAGIVLLAPAVLYAADPKPAAAPAAKSSADPNRMICHSDPEPGSLIAKRKICKTAAEWKEQANRDGQWAEHMSLSDSGKSN